MAFIMSLIKILENNRFEDYNCSIFIKTSAPVQRLNKNYANF